MECKIRISIFEYKHFSYNLYMCRTILSTIIIINLIKLKNNSGGLQGI